MEDREQGKYIKFTLPATPYEIQDGMERLGCREPEHLNFEITEYQGIPISGTIYLSNSGRGRTAKAEFPGQSVGRAG